MTEQPKRYVWVVSYSDRSAIQEVFDNEKMADFYLEAAQGGIKEKFEIKGREYFD